MGGSCIQRECFLRFLQRRPHLRRSSTSRYVVYLQYLLQLQCVVELLIRLNAAEGKLVGREVLKLAAFLNTKLYCLADHFVGTAERNTVPNQIGCACQRI